MTPENTILRIRGPPKLSLRPLTVDDASASYVEWLEDPEVTKYLESGKENASKDQIRAYIEGFERHAHDALFGIFDASNGLHVGNATLRMCRPYHGTVETGIMLGDRAYWGKGVGGSVLSAIVGHAFDEMGMRKVTCGIVVGNWGCERMVQSLGFEVEGVLRQEFRLGDEYLDVVRYGVFKEGFRPKAGGIDR